MEQWKAMKETMQGKADRVLAHYGPETKEVRDLLRSTVVRVLDQMGSKDLTGIPNWSRHPQAAKLSSTNYRHSRRRTTGNAHSRIRR